MNKTHVFHCMGKIFCAIPKDSFEIVSKMFYPYTGRSDFLCNVEILRAHRFMSSYEFLKHPRFTEAAVWISRRVSSQVTFGCYLPADTVYSMMSRKVFLFGALELILIHVSKRDPGINLIMVEWRMYAAVAQMCLNLKSVAVFLYAQDSLYFFISYWNVSQTKPDIKWKLYTGDLLGYPRPTAKIWTTCMTLNFALLTHPLKLVIMCTK